MSRPVNHDALAAEIGKTIFTPEQFERWFGPVTVDCKREAWRILLGLQHLASEFPGPEHHIWKITRC